MKKIRVLIIDDSAFMRKLIADFLSEDSSLIVVGTARNGEDGLIKIKELKPDVVTMDVEMPVLNGLETLKVLMSSQPMPVVMLSSTTKDGAENTIAAMEYGAVDFIEKPSGSISLDLHKIKADLIEKVVLASKVNINHLGKSSSDGKNNTKVERNYSKIELNESIVLSNGYASSTGSQSKQIVCIGTSTGGPRALQKVLTAIPGNIKAPVLIVQHMPPGFTKSLASRLNGLSDMTVKEAEEGDILENGTAYIAPGGFHLKAGRKGQDLILHLDESPPKNGHRPSVDVMFDSLSRLKEYRKIAVIMTGMGSDGREGLAAIKKNGEVKAIAESKETSIVFGMPRAAIEAGLIDEIQNVERIAESILKFV
ncbi:protein-glutamate methylesterase/protein-glutamine glutaminase [Cytobacillus sp. NCCP-133]|uniref:protein-glutamate methylesterase/protein-glutamine glutaminase n=1 Tax=Cytobacillus sp. NCCP-133 TaxID=766848 RepID=UPI00223299F5|nr:chemotaxis response regulator protein-glutamate methylesterase [Cytobacillus sp. NCCP-133]GLB59329.1 chemotaxis response regulator protein-glutamate methylesterase [Cytobacillus sp. NCCP-133]